MPKISVITPAVREEELELNRQSLLQQTFKDFEWIVCSPFPYLPEGILPFKHVGDPPKNPGDFMGENKAYNELFKLVNGELVVTLNDSIWLKPNALEVFWKHYQEDPMSCVAFMGNHYEKVIDGVGYNITYKDIRPNQFHSDFEPTKIIPFDACCSSIPAAAVKAVGKIDPIWDQYCCFGIREFMTQVVRLGYSLYMSKESGYLGQKHTKLYDKEDLWNEKFERGEMFYRQRGGL